MEKAETTALDPRRKLGAVALADLFLRLLRGAHDGADYGDVESNGDGSPDARGDVRTVARDGGAVLRADDGHLRAFRSADRRALDDDIRAWRRRGTPPPPPLDPSPAHNSTHYKSGASLAACKALAIAAEQLTLQSRAREGQHSDTCKKTAGRRQL